MAHTYNKLIKTVDLGDRYCLHVLDDPQGFKIGNVRSWTYRNMRDYEVVCAWSLKELTGGYTASCPQGMALLRRKERPFGGVLVYFPMLTNVTDKLEWRKLHHFLVMPFPGELVSCIRKAFADILEEHNGDMPLSYVVKNKSSHTYNYEQSYSPVCPSTA